VVRAETLAQDDQQEPTVAVLLLDGTSADT
jgi:hypothetical protein